ncbi:MAG: hypothetical protein H7Y04_07840 [Verrucomicrobia bacterium]|nr:hypothetical protein [Cytophagales bacterium]
MAGVEEISGEITADRRLTKNKRYLLKGNVLVTNGATLTIDPGTIIKGDKASNAVLIIGRGAKINAVGTATEPIVFTSNQPKGSRTYGDWGGVIILGRAVNNQNTDQPIEGLPTNPKFVYGGNSDNDNSGIMRYVRIEFCGIALQPGSEINGLTMGSVGSGTTIEYVQVSYSGDDSFEWFGGTVNGKYLIAYRGFDDDFDTDFGYTGKVQFGLALRDPFVADQSQSNGFEADNSASSTGNPVSAGIFSNITYVGPSRIVRGTGAGDGVENPFFGRGIHLRRNTSQSVFNSIIIGSNLAGISLDGSDVQAKYENPATQLSERIQLKGNIIAGTRPTSLPVRGGDFAWERLIDPGNPSSLTEFAAPEISGSIDHTAVFNANNKVVNVADLQMNNLIANSRITNPELLPGTSSVALTGAVFTDKAADAYFQKVAFRGAFGTSNWAAGWTNFDPQNTDY